MQRFSIWKKMGSETIISLVNYLCLFLGVEIRNRFPVKFSRLMYVSLFVLLFTECRAQPTNTREKEAFEKAEMADWKMVFNDSCAGDWTEQWFLDGQVASVSNSELGMQLTAGPQFKNDAFPNMGDERQSYIRARRYMPELIGLEGTNLQPDYFPDDLFAPGVPHKITVIKKERDLYMKVSNADQTYYCHYMNTDLPIIEKGRIGLRLMYTRSSRYANFNIYKL